MLTDSRPLLMCSNDTVLTWRSHSLLNVLCLVVRNSGSSTLTGWPSVLWTPPTWNWFPHCTATFGERRRLAAGVAV